MDLGSIDILVDSFQTALIALRVDQAMLVLGSARCDQLLVFHRQKVLSCTVVFTMTGRQLNCHRRVHAGVSDRKSYEAPRPWLP
jgi:hypothetical protein